MKQRLFLVLSIGFLLTSCGSKKAVSGYGSSRASAKRVIRHYQKTAPDFKTLQARLKGTYDDGEEKQSISISMRIQKDDTIWLSAKLVGLLPVAKAIITPDHVRYYDKINQRYFDGDFKLLSHWLGTALDFQKLQNLLIGRAIYPLDKNKYTLENSTNGFQLSGTENDLMTTSFMLDKSTFRLNGQQIKQPYKHSSVTINYSDYQKIEGSDFPKMIVMIVNQESELTKINIRYRTLDINTPVSFPFKIPSGYKELQL